MRMPLRPTRRLIGNPFISESCAMFITFDAAGGRTEGFASLLPAPRSPS